MSDGNPIAGLKDTSFDLTRKASVVVHVLERCLAGENPARISSGRSIAIAHGWPSTKLMHANLAALRPLGDLPVTFDIDPTHHRAHPRPAKEPTMQPTPAPPPRPRTYDCPDCAATYKQRGSRNQHHLVVHTAVRPGGKAAS